MKIFEKQFCQMGFHEFLADGYDDIWKEIDKYDTDDKEYDIKVTVKLVKRKYE